MMPFLRKTNLPTTTSATDRDVDSGVFISTRSLFAGENESPPLVSSDEQTAESRSTSFRSNASSGCGTTTSVASASTCSTSSTTFSHSTSTTSLNRSWNSCDSLDYHKGSPLIVTSLESGQTIEDEAMELGKVLAHSRRLPSTPSGFASDHVLVNHERTIHMVAPLVRMSDLDDIAHRHAIAMAQHGRLFHSNPIDIQSQFHRPSRRLGENIARGTSIREMHHAMMNDVSDRNNMLDRRYTNMGMGTAKSPIDGQLYLVELFRG